MNPTTGKNEYLMQSLAQSNRRLTSIPGKIKVEYPAPPPRTHTLGPMNRTPDKVEYPMLSLRAQSKQSMRSTPGTIKVEYPIPPPLTHTLQPMTSDPGNVACPSQPRIHSGPAMTMPTPQKAEYFPSKNDKQQGLNASVEKAAQEKRMTTIAKLCTKCNCRDYIGWCRDCQACFDCCPDFIDI